MSDYRNTFSPLLSRKIQKVLNNQSLPYPQLTRAEIDLMTDMLQNQKVLNTDTGSLMEYDGTKWKNLFDTQVIIRELADLPTPIAGEIILDPYTEYIFSAYVNIGTNKIVLSERSMIKGIGPLSSGLIHTGSGVMIEGIDVTTYFANLQLQSFGQLFSLTNLAKNKFIVLRECLLAYSYGGVVEGYNDVAFDYSRHFNAGSGFAFIDVENLAVTRQLYDDSVGGFHDYTSDQAVTVADGESVLLVSGNGIGTVGKVYENISGSGISINSTIDYTIDTTWEDITRHLIQLDSNGGSFNEVKIADNRFQVPDGYVGLDPRISDITIDEILYIITNRFTGDGVLKITDINAYSRADNTFFHNNVGIAQPVFLENLTTTQINNIQDPEYGVLVFNTNEDKPAIYTSNGWVILDTTDLLVTLFEEDWASGDFATNSWVTINNSVNLWVVGSADSSSGTYCAYITNNAAGSPPPSQYTINNAEVSHFYKDFAIPAGITEAALVFDFKGEAEVGYDYMRVYKAPTSYTPSAGSLPSGAASQIGAAQYNNKSNWETQSIDLGTGDAGTTIRIIFTWRNDGSVGVAPGAQVDNIKLQYK